MRKVTVAATQMKSRGFDREANIQAAEALIREAAGKGANIILIQELFQTDYFCQKMIDQNMKLALPLEEDPAVKRFSELAKELDVVLPVSFFEKDNQAHFNSLAIIDADGTILGTYRKSHIPDGAGYSSTLTSGILVLKFGKPSMQPSDVPFAGISGIRRLQEQWRSWEPSCCSIQQQSVPSRTRMRALSIPCRTGGPLCKDMPVRT